MFNHKFIVFMTSFLLYFGSWSAHTATEKFIPIKAVLFDTLGTVVDWRGGMIKALDEVFQEKGISHINSGAFADAWASAYVEHIERIQAGDAPFVTVDALNEMALERLFVSYEITHRFTPSERHELSKLWHRLPAWRDSRMGLEQLKKSYMIGTLSNGNVRLLVDLSKYNHLNWDVILSGEFLGRYKPAPEVYLSAAKILDLNPEEILLVASHKYDLEAAKALGFKTAYVFRPLEFGEVKEGQFPKPSEFDFVVLGIDELAKRLPLEPAYKI